MMLFLCLLIFLPKILVGFTIAHLLWRDMDFPAIVLKLAVGVPLGLAIGSSIFFLAAAAGVAPRVYSWIEFWVALLLLMIFLLRGIISRSRNNLVRPENGGAGMRPHPRFRGFCGHLLTFREVLIILKGETVRFPPFTWREVFGAFIFLAGVFLTAGAFLYYARMHPHGFEDAWSIWNLPARFIYRDNSSAILMDSQLYNRFHPDYPVELSLNVAWGWFILRQEAPRLPIAIALLSTFSAGLAAWGTLRKWKGIIAAALGALVIIITSNFPSAVGQHADPLLALYILSSAAMFYGFLKIKDPNLLLLAGLLAGFSAWVKNEGWLFMVVFSFVCLLAAWKHVINWGDLKSLALGLMLPVLVVLLYKFIVAWQNDLVSSPNSLLTQILDLSRWRFITRNFIINVVNYASWPVSVLILLTIYALLIGFDRSESTNQILLLLLLAGQLMGYFFIYLITPHNLELHVTTSMDRLISHLFPLAVLWLFVALRSPELKAADHHLSHQ